MGVEKMGNYTIKCDCGVESTGTDRRNVEAQQWHHAIQQHSDMLKGMGVEQFTQIMKGWDKQIGK